jgi:hypothetical protein
MWKIPLITAQYIMYDMPDDQIIGFWGKRPFLGKGIPRPTDYTAPEPLQLPALASAAETASVTPPPEPALLPSWHADPQLFRHWQPRQAVYATAEET